MTEPTTSPIATEPAPSARPLTTRRWWTRGRRGFAKEVAIVVLGVLIALAAQETVQWLDRREEVAEARQALNHELAGDRARLHALAAQDRCYDVRVARLERWAVTPGRPALAALSPATMWNLHTSAWEVAKTGQVAAHMPLADRLTYSRVYAVLERQRELIERETVAFQDMAAIALGPVAADPDGLRLRSAAATVRMRNRARRANHAPLERYFERLGIRPDSSSMADVPVNDLCASLEFAQTTPAP